MPEESEEEKGKKKPKLQLGKIKAFEHRRMLAFEVLNIDGCWLIFVNFEG